MSDGQGTKIETASHLPGNQPEDVRGLGTGTSAISPCRFQEWTEISQIKTFVHDARDRTGGIPIGDGLRAQHPEKGIDYVTLDGRGGGMGADAIAVSRSAKQAFGGQTVRACRTINCPVGVATQKPQLFTQIFIGKSALRLANFFAVSFEFVKGIARACGHDHVNTFNPDDVTTRKKKLAALSAVTHGGLA